MEKFKDNGNDKTICFIPHTNKTSYRLSNTQKSHNKISNLEIHANVMKSICLVSNLSYQRTNKRPLKLEPP